MTKEGENPESCCLYREENVGLQNIKAARHRLSSQQESELVEKFYSKPQTWAVLAQSYILWQL